jgi:minor fimbrial subunit
LPITGTSDGYQYLKLNDYLDGAMKITDSYAGEFYPPQNYIQMGAILTSPKTNRLAFRISTWSFALGDPTFYQYGGDPARHHVPRLRHHHL